MASALWRAGAAGFGIQSLGHLGPVGLGLGGLVVLGAWYLG